MSTACQQLEVFSRVLRTSLATLLDGGEENLEKNLPEFAVSLFTSFFNPSAQLYLDHTPMLLYSDDLVHYFLIREAGVLLFLRHFLDERILLLFLIMYLLAL